MADNTTFGAGNNATPPAGLVVSLEEITTLNGGAIVTGEKAQRVIPALRTGDGVVVDVPGNGTDGILVNLGANNDISGTVTANAGTNLNTSALALESGGNLAAVAASASVLDDWDETDRAKVNLIVGQAGVAAGAGAVGATTPRVTLASDDPAVVALQALDDVVLAEDAAHGSGDKGIQALAVRNDSDASLAGTTGDYTPLQVDATGYLKVNIKAGGGTGGTAMTDDAAFTAASTSFTPVGGIVTADSVDSGDGGAFAMLANRQQKVTLYDSAGVELSVGGGTQYDEDTAHVSGDKVTLAGVVRKDVAGTLASTDGDRTVLQVDANGALLTKLNTAVSVSNEVSVNVLDVIPGTSATALGKAEDGIHTTGDVGVMALAVRQNTQADFGADGDYVPLSVADDGGVRVSSTNTAAASPIAVRISDGSAFPTPGTDYTHDAALTVGSTAGPATVVRASAANPSDVSADDDAAVAWADRKGAQVVAGRIVDDAAFTPGTDRVHPVGFFADEASTDSVDEGDLGAARMTLDRKQIVTPYAHAAAGGATPGKLVSAASTNATSVKGSAGKIYMLTASNVNAAARYLKVYDKATAPTVGTDTPVGTFIIPGNTAGAGTNIPVPACGLQFTLGIGLALTTEATDAGTTGVAANEIVVNYAYS